QRGALHPGDLGRGLVGLKEAKRSLYDAAGHLCSVCVCGTYRKWLERQKVLLDGNHSPPQGRGSTQRQMGNSGSENRLCRYWISLHRRNRGEALLLSFM